MSTLGEDYLKGRDGSIPVYHECLFHGQRVGQAFFNALSLKDQARLRSTLYDPFYSSNPDSVARAIDWLLLTEDFLV